MPKLSEILGEKSFKQIPEDLQTKYKDIDLVDSKQYVSKDKFDTLNQQLNTANDTITTLKKDNKGNETLQTKVGEYENKVKEYEKQIKDMQFNYALEGALKGANVRNTKAVKALLNLENIKLDGENLLGLKEQLDSLNKSDSYLFEEEQKPQFSGIRPTDGSKSPQGYNPWKKDSFNLTDQGKIFKENQEQAKQLMAEAGVNL
ncbi:phage scaffolding protein [Clostridium botulinum]|uniref:Scaffolding protein n=1 Tax=Clostridium botulinum C/D str. DC5 TaxID=1443128 RepID=A0A0A0II97_CLOBO|nr:phage scaffolding protein [Clostridium botulinum]KGN00319.1 scaffolding protein [Clostridium botulinum C/D str. DC5]KOC51324.1 scaffolding protein [Clostridium botulinum]KOC53688.1 scaffolding protein [Clostridium botulinum]MCD3234607.1 scaffolding protein [Clostridium botulinum D/C]MCD3239750.1 scaffolding protein [Clostridium botulinum D/C]